MPLLQKGARQTVCLRAYEMALSEEPTPQKEEDIQEKAMPRLRQENP